MKLPKPRKDVIFTKIYKKDTYFDCRKQKWVTLIPPQELKIAITLESDYPHYVFGAPKQYVMYIAYKGKKKVLAAGNTINELAQEVYRWRENKCFWANYGEYIADAIGTLKKRHTTSSLKLKERDEFGEERRKLRQQLRNLLVRMYGTKIESDVDEIIKCIERKVAELYRQR